MSSGGRARASKRVAMQACTSTGFPYCTKTVPYFHFDRIINFGPYRTVIVPYIRSENGDTAYKHNTGSSNKLWSPFRRL